MADDEEVDVSAILARLNAAGRGDTEDSSDVHADDTETPLEPTLTNQTTEKVEPSVEIIKEELNKKKELKVSEVHIVRDQPEDEGSKKDILVEHASVINLSPAIMTEPEKYLSLLESQPLRAIFDSVRATFATSTQQIVEKQKGIFEHLARTKDHSTVCLNHYLQKNTLFGKLKPVEIEGKLQEVKGLAQDGQKAKHYLLLLIKRLEDLEGKLDNMIVVKSQEKEKAPKPVPVETKGPAKDIKLEQI